MNWFYGNRVTFVILTDISTGEKFRINVDNIIAYRPTENGTKFYFVDGRTLETNEPSENVDSIIRGDFIKPLKTICSTLEDIKGE